MNINEHLATVVMGWERNKAESYPYWLMGDPPYELNRDAIRIEDWNPPENIEQAIMCAEALDRLRAITFEYNKKGKVRARIDLWNSTRIAFFDFYGVWTDTSAETLSLAVARATGWEEE